MRIALISDVFPPFRSSGAVLVRDLSQEFVRQGHEVTVLIPSPELTEDWRVDIWNGVRVVRLKSPKIKNIGNVRRTIGEFLMPLAVLRNLRKSPVVKYRYDGVVCYAPSIFLGPIFKAIKRASSCKSYLIMRDLFPEWAVDMGLMSRGLPYRVFKLVESYLYSVADVIGVQTPANLGYFARQLLQPHTRTEVLQNWLADAPIAGCSISVQSSPLVGRKIFVYAGNMGIAQGMGLLLELAAVMRDEKKVGFLFVGRGSDALQLQARAKALDLDNVAFYDEIEPSEILGLYAQCHAGIVALDPRHKTHNIPGKFLSYMQAGLPVLAAINPGNDLEKLINDERVGKVCIDASVDTLKNLAFTVIEQLVFDPDVQRRCKALSKKLFSPESAVKQIVSAL